MGVSWAVAAPILSRWYSSSVSMCFRGMRFFLTVVTGKQAFLSRVGYRRLVDRGLLVRATWN